MAPKRIAALTLFAALVLFILVFLGGSRLWITYLWFRSLGFTNLFWTPMAAKAIIGGTAFLASTAFLWSLWGTMRVETEAATLRTRGITLIAALAASFVLTGWITDKWSDILLLLNHTTFGVADPVFKKDASWYVFVYPILSTLASWLMAAAVFGLAGCVVLSQLDWRKRIPAGRVSFLGALFLLLAVARIQLSTLGLVYSPRGTAFGASYTDVHAQIPANYVFMAILVALAIYLFINVPRRHLRAIPTAATVAVASWLLVVGLFPALFQKLVVAPNELAKETPYLRHNIKMTRLAYNLDAVEEKPYTLSDLTPAKLSAEGEVVRNARLVDYKPAQAVFSQLQELRPYYSFSDLDLDRYRIDGKLTQVVISVRELDSARLPETAKTWVNERLKYTHGYGFVMSPVGEITRDGQPTFLVKDFPPKGAIKVEQPRIYVGELSNDYVFVNTTTKEFDYPKGDSNQYYEYTGKDGLKLGSGLRRLAFGWNYGITKVLLSGYLKPDSRILINRRVIDRVNTLMPFITWGRDPYPVYADGRLQWIVEGLVTTDRFPFSEPLSNQVRGASRVNYIRNSVKAVVDAYNGTVNFYADMREPMAASYAKAFPVFRDFGKMPESIKAHIKYAEELFNVQAIMFRSYHMTDPQVFFNKEDQWSLAQEITNQSGDRQGEQEAYYAINRLEGAKEPEFVLTRTFTPISKENMISWMAARSDGENYGKLLVYKFSKQNLVYGPMQVEAKIDQDTELSQNLTLWNQQGSQVIRGNTMAYPIGRSILYVQPIYLQAEQGRIPELKKIVTFANGRLGVGDTLRASLQDLLETTDIGQPETTAPVPVERGKAPADKAPAADIDTALRSLKQAQQSAGTGDWQSFGQELENLERILNDLRSSQKR